ncbi:hypothetical protein R5K32_15280 [Acinetobacter baumannii]|uniref:hypothetical protein n=1 Tax=Acinetobacter baumannii TaxID=470 RepID=UPI002236159D|nr:hypothetical protein [Acinetobacter baumannii]MDW2811499.1 hypothetical protein [Acinetobacter baumannii]UZG64179.1 hypothetical protein OMP06_19460 [Acinetobacter baumannii]
MKHYEFLCQKAAINRDEDLVVQHEKNTFRVVRYNAETDKWEALMTTTNESVLKHFLRHYAKPRVSLSL